MNLRTYNNRLQYFSFYFINLFIEKSPTGKPIQSNTFIPDQKSLALTSGIKLETIIAASKSANIINTIKNIIK